MGKMSDFPNSKDLRKLREWLEKRLEERDALREAMEEERKEQFCYVLDMDKLKEYYKVYFCLLELAAECEGFYYEQEGTEAVVTIEIPRISLNEEEMESFLKIMSLATSVTVDISEEQTLQITAKVAGVWTKQDLKTD